MSVRWIVTVVFAGEQSTRYIGAIRTHRAPLLPESQMKLSMTVLFPALVLAGLYGCGHSRDSEALERQGTLKGVVYVVGNEPFTHLAVQDSAGRMHRITGPKAVEDLLYQRQGKTVEVTVVGTEQESEGPIVRISGLVHPPVLPGGPADSVSH